MYKTFFDHFHELSKKGEVTLEQKVALRSNIVTKVSEYDDRILVKHLFKILMQ